MTDFKQVSAALARGDEPEMLCMTCPWDRFCVTPPTMTAQDVEAERDKAKARDDETTAAALAAGKSAPVPMGQLLTLIMLDGKDTSAQVCPVFALRLRSEEGAALVQTIRSQMRASR